MDYASLTAKEIGARIDEHLKRFEQDPVINEAKAGPGTGGMKLPRFFEARAYGERKYVYVQYKLNQGFTRITRAEAAQYLAWLDAGNVGRHQQALQAVQA